MSAENALLARVFVRQRANLEAYIWSIVHNEHLVEDVLQEVCALAISKCKDIQNEQALIVWMRRAARFEACKLLRSQAKNPLALNDQTLELLEQDWSKIDDDALDSRREALRDCMEQLTPRSRSLVQLRYQNQLKPSQIARQLNQKVESVYVTMSRILGKLGDCVRQKIRRNGEVQNGS